jgi:HD superfamily phosphohydrolase
VTNLQPLPLRAGLHPSLGSVSAALQRALSTHITEYIASRKRRRPSLAPKIINDPVWRTVRLEPWELYVLDSPVVQRLRRIHQLGLAGYVFPGASYSRFEHSVGVVHQTQRLIDAINRNARVGSPRSKALTDGPVSPTSEVFLRLAALVHDVGHCFLSHVSERALARLDPLAPGAPKRQVLQDAKAFFGLSCEAKAPAISELLSALIVLLPEFEDLLANATVPGWDDAAALAMRIARVIVGAADPKAPYLTEIISGAMDADKLDYLPRDCYMAGLPMPVDVDRILEKVHVLRMPVSQLPESEEYASLTQLRNTDLVEVLVVHPGGARAVEELVVSRFLLYSKLYYHQKVRCLEGVVVNALELLMRSEPEFRQLETFLTLTDEEFLSGRWNLGNLEGGPDAAAAARLVWDVSNRRSFVRCYAFGPPLAARGAEDAFRLAWEKLEPLVTQHHTENADEFRTAVCDRATWYLRAVGQAGLADRISTHDILIDLPDVQGITEKTGRLFVGDDQNGVVRYSDKYKVNTWSEAYEDQKTLGYVYTRPEYALAVHFAFADVCKERTGLVFGNGAWMQTKLAPAELNQFASFLKAGLKDGYRDFPLPEPLTRQAEYLRSTQYRREVLSAHAQEIAELGDRFKTFQSGSFSNISTAVIDEWLLQFEPDEIPLALTILQNVRFWNRGALVDALAEGIRRTQSGHREIQALAVAGPRASGHHLDYYFDDLRTSLPNCRIDVLESAVQVRENVPLLLYEDNVGLGRQASTVIQQWFGRPRSEWLLDEEHVQPLDGRQRLAFTSCPLGLLFITGPRTGADTVGKWIRDLAQPRSFSSWVVSPTELSCFQPAARVFKTRDSARAAENAFRRAGRVALQHLSGDWTEERIENSLLGYGNMGQLTVFDYNTPPTTLTALWSGERDWKPLFPRRKRER